MRPTLLKQPLTADVEAFLAKGGEIKRYGVTMNVKPYNGTRAQVNKVLRSAGWCAASMCINRDQFDILSRSADFPQAYSFEGELYWKPDEIKTYNQKRRAA